MGKDYVIAGQIQLDVARWKKQPAALSEVEETGARAWPAVLGPLDGGETGGTVADALARVAKPRDGHLFLEIRTEKNAATLEGVLGEDELRDRGTDLAAVLAAAEAIGARGRVQVRDLGVHEGAAITFDARGRHVARLAAHRAPTADDAAAIQRVLARLGVTAPSRPAKGARPDRWVLQVAGEITLATKAWLAAPARTGRDAWPTSTFGTIAPESEHGTVAHALATLALDEGPSFLEVAVTARSATLSGSLREGAFLDRASALAAVLTAAAACGGTGRVQVRLPGVWSGASVALEACELRFGTLPAAKRLAPKDAALFERVAAGLRARSGVALSADAKKRIAAREKARKKKR